MLTISRYPAIDGDPDAHLAGKNRFECRTCPYQYILDKRYYERKVIKPKEVEDVVGGAQMWENADRTAGMLYSHFAGRDGRSGR